MLQFSKETMTREYYLKKLLSGQADLTNYIIRNCDVSLAFALRRALARFGNLLLCPPDRCTY